MNLEELHALYDFPIAQRWSPVGRECLAANIVILDRDPELAQKVIEQSNRFPHR